MFKNYIEENKMKAVIHLLEIKNVKNSDAVQKKENGVYIHTNTKNKTKYYIVCMSYTEYQKYEQKYINIEHKMNKVMGFYILELNEYIK